MRIASFVGLFFAGGILLMAIPQIDAVRSTLVPLVPSTMQPWISYMLILVGLGAFIVIFAALFKVIKS